jgi:hypothetical protein
MRKHLPFLSKRGVEAARVRNLLQPPADSRQRLGAFRTKRGTLQIAEPDSLVRAMRLRKVEVRMRFEPSSVRMNPQEWLRIFYVRLQDCALMVMVALGPIAEAAGRQEVRPLKCKMGRDSLAGVMIDFQVGADSQRAFAVYAFAMRQRTQRSAQDSFRLPRSPIALPRPKPSCPPVRVLDQLWRWRIRARGVYHAAATRASFVSDSSARGGRCRGS